MRSPATSRSYPATTIRPHARSGRPRRRRPRRERLRLDDEAAAAEGLAFRTAQQAPRPAAARGARHTARRRPGAAAVGVPPRLRRHADRDAQRRVRRRAGRARRACAGSGAPGRSRQQLLARPRRGALGALRPPRGDPGRARTKRRRSPPSRHRRGLDGGVLRARHRSPRSETLLRRRGSLAGAVRRQPQRSPARRVRQRRRLLAPRPDPHRPARFSVPCAGVGRRRHARPAARRRHRLRPGASDGWHAQQLSRLARESQGAVLGHALRAVPALLRGRLRLVAFTECKPAGSSLTLMAGHASARLPPTAFACLGLLVASGCSGHRSAAHAARAARAQVPAGFVAEAFAAVGARDLWVLGSAPCRTGRCTVVVRTRDGGRTFARAGTLPLPTEGTTPSLAFADDRNGFAFVPGFDGVLYATHDGGKSWHRQALGGGVSFTQLKTEALANSARLAAASGTTAVLFGNGAGSRLMRTTDGGASWKPARTPRIPSDVWSLAFTSSRVGFALVQTGWDAKKKVERQMLWRTTDAGARWSELQIR